LNRSSKPKNLATAPPQKANQRSARYRTHPFAPEPSTKGETVQKLRVIRPARVRQGRGGGMKWRVIVEAGDDSAVHVDEVGRGHSRGVVSGATLGLAPADSKGMLAGLQRHLVQAQTAEHCRARRQCQHCRG